MGTYVLAREPGSYISAHILGLGASGALGWRGALPGHDSIGPMTDSVVKRPPLLTGACVYLGSLAAIMAIRAVTVVTTWNGDNRASDFATTLEALRDAGMSADGAETFYTTTLTVLAVLAACGVVFAVFTARGDRASRVGMTVAIGITGFLSFTGLLGGGFLFAMIGALAVVFTIRLWTGEIRTYFRALAGHAPPTPPATPSGQTPRPDPFADPSRHPAASAPVTPSDAARAEVPTEQAPPGYQQAWPPQAPRGREPLPRSVSVAVWTALVGSITAAGFSAMMLLAIAVLGVDYEAVIAQGGPGADMIRGSESDFDTALQFIVVMSSIAVVLGVGGLVAAIRVLVTRRSGDVLLFVMTVVTLIFSVIGFPLGLPWTVAAIVALVQLRRQATKQWFVKT